MNARLLLVLLCVPVWAGDSAPDLKGLSLEELLHVEVTSVRKKDQPLDQTPAAVYVITRDQIRRSGMTSIPELLRLAPGVNVARINGNSWAISVRSFNGSLSNKLLVMIDGRVVYNPLFSGVFWDAQDTLIEDIDRIEVVRGPVSPQWGANAVNGAINVITRPADQTQGGLLDVGTGTEDRGHEGVRYGGSSGPDTFYRIYGQSNARPEWAPIGSTLPAGTWGSIQGGGRVDHRFSPDSELTVQGDGYSELGSLFGSTIIRQAPFQAVASSPLDSSGGNILARWTERSATGAETVIQTYFDQLKRGDPRDLGTSIETADLDIQHWFHPTGRQQFTAAAGYRQMWDRAQNTTYSVLTPASSVYGTAYISLADEIELKPDRLKLTLAARGERSGLSGYTFQPTARLWWSLAKRQSMWVAWTRAARTPSRGELAFQGDWAVMPAGPLAAVITVSGNPNLQPETSNAVDAGYRIEFKHLSFDLSAFHYEYRNLTSIELGQPQLQSGQSLLVLPGSLGNGDLGTSTGGELTAVFELPGGSRLSASYSGDFSEIHHMPAPNDGSIFPEHTTAYPYGPQNQWQANWQTSLPHRVQLNLWASHVGRIDSGQPAIQADVPAYTRADVQLSRRIGEGGTVQVGGQNLLTPRHVEFIPEAQVPPSVISRSFYVRFIWRF